MTNTSQTYRELGENFYNNRTIENYNALYNKVRPGLKNYIYKMVGDKDKTEDILSSTLIKLWTKIHQFNPKYQITTWLYRIAFNECLGYFRQEHRKLSIDNMAEYGYEASDSESASDSTKVGPESKAIQDVVVENEKTENQVKEEDDLLQTQYERVLDHIQTLSPIYQQVMQDRVFNNMKYEDIAQKNGLKLQTVKNRIRRARIIISNSLRREFDQIMI